MLFKIRNTEKFIEGFKERKYSLEDASSRIFRDKDTVLTLLKYDPLGNIYNFMPRKLQKNEEFVKEMVGVNGYVFLKASKFHSNNEIAMSAIKTCADAAACLNFDRGNGLKIAKEAVTINAFALKYLHKYADNQDVIKIALNGHGILYRYLSEQQKLNEDFAEIALSTTPFVYRFLPKELKQNTDLALTAIGADGGYAYSIYKDLLDKEVKADPQVAVMACSKNLDSVLNVPNDTFEGIEFQEAFKEMTDKTIAEYKEKGDIEGLQSYEGLLNALITEKNEMVLQEKLDRAIAERDCLEGNEQCDEGAELHSELVLPKDITLPQNNLEE